MIKKTDIYIDISCLG